MNLLALITLVALSADGAPVLDAPLETSTGRKVTLASLWGKPAVFFYEDKDSVLLNLKLKQDLAARAGDRGWTDKLSVIAVANVSSWNWFPAKGFVLSAVRDAEKKTHVPVYLDFEGSITRPPWRLSGNGSTVMVFDAHGTPLRTWSGKLNDADFEALSGVLEPLIR